jgi:F-type H+-transporting ATPase subunit gamma
MLIKEIKKHIRTTQEIARICEVMYLISASKLLKVRKRRELARHYFKQMLHLVSLADAHVKKKDSSLLKQRPVRKLWYVVVTPDRGFCGGLPSTINRWATTSAEEQQSRMAQKVGREFPTIEYLTVGKKGRDYIIRTKRNLVKEFTQTVPTWALALQIAQIIVEAFDKEEVDAAFIVYARSDVETPEPVVEQILPVSLSQKCHSLATEQEPAEPAADINRRFDGYIFYTPKLETIFSELIRRFPVCQIYGALLESAISEHTVRMVKMKQATKNIKEVLNDLTVAYHFARQAQITTDLLEITSASEALRQQPFP